MYKIVHVFCLEGVHGVGKSTTAEELKKEGYCIMDENFMEYNNAKLNPQHLMLKSRY